MIFLEISDEMTSVYLIVLQSNIKLFNIRINVRNIVITGVVVMGCFVFVLYCTFSVSWVVSMPLLFGIIL